MNPVPQSLADIEPHTVRALSAWAATQLKRWAEEAGQRYVEVDLSNLRNRKAALQAIGTALALPQWYGANLDALYDCLTDLMAGSEVRGYVFLLKGFAQTSAREGLSVEDRSELLDVFRDAVTECVHNDQAPLRVFYV